MAACCGRYFTAGLAGLGVIMEYLVLLLICVIAALVWYYYEFVHPIPGCDDADDDQEQRLLVADEAKRACWVIISFCTIIAAIMGASEW